MKFFFKIICLCILIFFSSFGLARNMTKDDLMEGSKAYGFYLGQEYTLQQIVKKYPELKLPAEKARLEFDLKFKGSIQNIDSKFKVNGKEKWNEIKEKLSSEINSYLSYSIGFEEATKFITDVEERAKGNIDKSILEALLLFNPKYEITPELEFAEHYTYIYENNGSGKSKGVPFKLKVPVTWKAEEGERANVVQKFTEKNGRGFAIFMVMIKNSDVDKVITRDDVDELLNDKDGLQEIVPYNGKLLSNGKFTLEGLPGFWIKFEALVERGKNVVQSENIQYMIFYNDKIISLSGQVTKSVNGNQVNTAGIDKYEPLFDMMVNSFVLPNLYRK